METRIRHGLLKVVRWLREHSWWLVLAVIAVIAAIFGVIGFAIAPVPAWFTYVCAASAIAALIAARVTLAKSNYIATMVATGLLIAVLATVFGSAVRMSF